MVVSGSRRTGHLGDGWLLYRLSYATPGAAPLAGAAPAMFHNVYMQPWAYREFNRTGEFPQGTMFVLSFYEASFGDTASVGTRLPGTAACYSCHATEAAHDNVFTQIYPFMRERLAQKVSV